MHFRQCRCFTLPLTLTSKYVSRPWAVEIGSGKDISLLQQGMEQEVVDARSLISTAVDGKLVPDIPN